MRRATLGVAGLLVLGSLLAFVSTVPPAARGTDVPAGDIPVDTTWDAAGSPYVVRGNVSVAPGVTLTIGPGAEVRFAGNYSLISGAGRIYADGSASQAVTFAPSVDNGMPAQWGRLDVNGLHDCRITGGAQVSVGFYGYGGAADRCWLDRVDQGLMAYGSREQWFGNITIRRASTGLVIVAAVDSTFSNVTVEGAGIGVVMQHAGNPMTGSDSDRTVLRGLTVSGFTEGVRVVSGDLPPPKTNRIVRSEFRDGGTVFPSNFTGHVYWNNFVNTSRDFGFPAADGLGYYDDGTRGNYWSNYTGTDGDGDGIGDTPYGPDRYPLMAPVPSMGRPFPPAPLVLLIEPSGFDVPLNASIVVRFSAQMETASAEAALTVSPAFSHTTEWTENAHVVSLVPSAPLTEGTTYTATVVASARDVNGTALPNAFSGTFRTAAPPTVVDGHFFPWSSVALAVLAIVTIIVAVPIALRLRWRPRLPKDPVT